MRYISLIFWLIILAIAISFSVLNAHQVPLNYYIGKTQLFLPLLLLVTLVVGLILGIIGLLPRYFKLKRTIYKLKQECDDKTTEIKNLRSIPLNDDH